MKHSIKETLWISSIIFLIAGFDLIAWIAVVHEWHFLEWLATEISWLFFSYLLSTWFD